jgi:hypothetical protein
MSFWICRTCAVEHAEKIEVCRICADERQWVPADGQHWTTLEKLRGEGYRVKIVRTPAGCLLWDPLGYVDDEAVRRVRELGEVYAIAASHPHMFGAQVEWSRALGGVTVYVNSADMEWVARPDPAIRPWSGRAEVLPGVTLAQAGGHFPGSAVVHWPAGAGGAGVLLAGDTIFANPDRVTVSFMRSYPNRIPLSGAVVERVTRFVEGFEFDRLYSNFGNAITSGAREVVRRSADRHIGWVNGDFDHLT